MSALSTGYFFKYDFCYDFIIALIQCFDVWLLNVDIEKQTFVLFLGTLHYSAIQMHS